MSPILRKFAQLVTISSLIMISPYARGGKMQSAQTHEFTLDNQLKVIVKEDHRAPVVVSQVWYKVGSKDERRGLTGISHALEHMMFQGSKKFPKDEFSTWIAKHGGQNNAFTSEDYTAYYEELAAENLKVSFEAEADRMHNLLLEEEAFLKEIEVVKEERRLRTDDNPQSYTYERFKASAYPAGPYNHPIIGWPDDLETMTVEDLRQWYKNWYAPNNAILVVVGDVDPNEVHMLAKEYFGNIPMRELNKSKAIQELTPVGQRRIQVHRKAKLPLLIMGYNTPTLKTVADPKEAYALYVASSILDVGESSRFNKDLVKDKELAVNVSAHADILSYFDSLFLITGIPTPNTDVATLEKAILEHIDNLKNNLVPNDELERVKTQLIAQEVFEKDSVSEQATMLGSVVALDLPWQILDNFVDNIKAVTSEDVQKVAQKYFVPTHQTVAELIPQAIS